MKQLIAQHELDIPEGVKIEVKGRRVRVTGPRGTLTRDFKHTKLDFEQYTSEPPEAGAEPVLRLRITCPFGKRKSLAVIRTTASHIVNLVTGVTKGFEYKMRLVYAHFPININIVEDGKVVEIRNFLGEKRVRVAKMLPGVTIVRSTAVKDELTLSGSDVDLVSHSAALINGLCHVRNKDIRKFLDGIYISERGLIDKGEE